MSDTTPTPYRAWIRDIVTLLLILAMGAWLFVPGFGPDVLGLQQRFGWNIWSLRTGSVTELNPQMRTELSHIRVRTEQYESTTAYHRNVFGQAWADIDRNGCDTRNDVLARDLTGVTFRKGNCKVAAGTLTEPYTGRVMQFVAGPKTSPLVQIDHVVALGDAWRSGAQQWSAWQRQRFANDPLNLLAVEGQANQDKASAAADEWLPQVNQCPYVARQVAVKRKWDLSMTATEMDAVVRVLSQCPEVTVPPDSGAVPAR